MLITIVLALSVVLLGYGLSRRVLGADDGWEALSLGLLVGTLLLIAGGNVLGPIGVRLPMIGLGLILGGALCWGSLPSESSESIPPSSVRWRWALAALLVTIVGYVIYAGFFLLDTDNWVHEPLIATYSTGLFPPQHPFFAGIELKGHYGRDLLIATLLPRGTDSLVVVWVLNPLLALAAAGVILAIFRRSGDTPTSTLTAIALPFFGICVGFRVGMADCFDGNNGVVYTQAVALFYVMLRVFGLLPSPRRLPVVPLGALAGLLLGTYCLVYETHFGLFMLTGAVLLGPALWRSTERGRLAVGIVITIVVAFGVAATEGGPITDIAQAKMSGRAAPETMAEANIAQHVTMKFPKTELFKVMATSADYMRVSPGFQLDVFRSMRPSTDNEGYLSTFSSSFLVTHWLPVFFAPFTLVWLIRRRHYPGLAFWVFGAWAYLVPGLIDFGPTYELEYYRWQYAAGFGFAVPLGLLCGDLLSRDFFSDVRKRRAVQTLGAIILILALWPAEKMVNRAIIDFQKNGLPPILSPGEWRVARPELGVTAADIACAQVLNAELTPGDFMMTNLGSESPLGIWPDCVISGVSAARIAGRAHPPEGKRLHAHPLYYRSSLQKVLMATGRLDLLEQAGVPWLVIDPSTTPLDEALEKSPQAKKVFESSAGGATRQLWRWTSQKQEHLKVQPLTDTVQVSAVLEGAGKPELVAAQEWRSNTVVGIRLEATNQGRQAAALGNGWVRIRVLDAENREVTEPISYRLLKPTLEAGAKQTEDFPIVTPLGEGDFHVLVEIMTGPEAGEVVADLPLRLSLLERLGALEGSLEVPGAVAPKTFAPLKLKLSSKEAIRSIDELDLRVRYHQDGGDYVWELDRLAIPLELDIPANGSQTVEWNIVSPWRPGTFKLELELFDHGTGQPVPIVTPQARLTVDVSRS